MNDMKALDDLIDDAMNEEKALATKAEQLALQSKQFAEYLAAKKHQDERLEVLWMLVKDAMIEQGITEHVYTSGNAEGMERTLEWMDRDFEGLCFVNLVDFDAKWGHRRNPKGYGRELERFDVKLGELLPYLRDDDLVMISADHGNDPTWTGSDHTRELVPLILYSPSFKGSGLLREGDTFSDIGATIAENFDVEMPEYGTSVLKYLI